MRKLFAFCAPFLLAVATACSQTGGPESELADGDVTIEMRDTLFSPDDLTVDRGQEVTFRFVNKGKLRHDAFIGDEEAQGMHEEEARMSDDEGHGGHAAEEKDAITVEPGKTGTLTYRFTKRGETIIGCHEPGHYTAGMRMKVDVT
jgi:uncharacterized cupredoxin-like copper-binding protein